MTGHCRLPYLGCARGSLSCCQEAWQQQDALQSLERPERASGLPDHRGLQKCGYRVCGGGCGCCYALAMAILHGSWLCPTSPHLSMYCYVEHGLETIPSYDFQAVWPWEELNPSETLILPTPRLAMYPSFWLVSMSPSSQILGLQHLLLPQSES